MDDTAALQAALDHARGRYVRGTLYLPNGTYNISASLKVKTSTPDGADADASGVTVQGQSRTGVVIRLKDNVAPATLAGYVPVFNTNSKADGSQDDFVYGCFMVNFKNLTIDVGSGNPRAIGMQYTANNLGRLEYVDIRSSDPSRQGKYGLFLGVLRANNTENGNFGPALLKHVTIDGFDKGIRIPAREYGVVIEHLTLRNQRNVGIENNANVLTLRNVWSTGITGGPVLRNINSALSQITLVGGNFSSGASTPVSYPAIDNPLVGSATGTLYARDITCSGYSAVIRQAGNNAVASSFTGEWRSHGEYSLSPSCGRSLNLPIRETPDPETSSYDPSTRRSLRSHGANPGADPNWDNNDDTAALQSALDAAAAEGRTTVYLPWTRGGKYRVSSALIVPRGVRRLVGLWSRIEPSGALVNTGTTTPLPIFRVADGDASTPPLIIEEIFFPWNTTPSPYYILEHACSRPGPRGSRHPSRPP